MRYAIKCNDETELNFRLEYLEEIFQMKFLYEKRKDEFNIYYSFPITKLNVFIILGHTPDVIEFLKKNKIKEKILVINTCYPGLVLKTSKIKSKKIYFSRVEKDGKNHLFIGKEYGFNFDITNSELDLLNSKKIKLIDKIKDAYIKI